MLFFFFILAIYIYTHTHSLINAYMKYVRVFIPCLSSAPEEFPLIKIVLCFLRLETYLL